MLRLCKGIGQRIFDYILFRHQHSRQETHASRKIGHKLGGFFEEDEESDWGDK